MKIHDISELATKEQWLGNYCLLKAFVQKGCISLFLADFHFLHDRANFWQTELFWHEKHRSVIDFVDLRFVFEK